MIRDTSAQDRVMTAPSNRRKQVVWIGLGLATLAAIAVCVPTIARLMSADSSASSARLRIAEVKRGDLVRDVSVQGRVVAAVSPTLYARTAGTVTLDVHAGDKVKKGDVLAEIDSPELTNKLKQEQATLDSLGLEVERATIDNRKAQAATQMAFEQAVIDRQTAEREVERNEKAFQRGAQPEMTVLRAKDALAKSRLSETNAQHNVQLDRDSLAFELKTRRFALDRQRLLVEDLGRQVDELKMRSPVDGQVGQLVVQQRANVAANAAILSVVDLSALEIEVQVPEVFAHDLSAGMSVKKFADTVPEADRKRLHDAVIAAVDGKVRPAYRKLADFVEKDYAPKGRTDEGLWALPDGDKLYRFAVRQMTTTTMDPAAIHELGLSEVKRIEDEQTKIAVKLGYKDLKAMRVALDNDPKAHAGRVHLANRSGGGLAVTLVLPMPPA